MPDNAHQCQMAKADEPIHARLLLAEDNLINQKVTLRLAGKLGYKVDVVQNGAQAIDALLRHPYPTVLMGCGMPEMGGIEAAQGIRELERSGKLAAHTRLIAITANAWPEYLERCLQNGMDDCLTLPLRIEQLEIALGKFKP